MTNTTTKLSCLHENGTTKTLT